MADAIILNYADYETTQKLVNSLKEFMNLKHICVVDNTSPDDSFIKLKELSSSKVDVIQAVKNGGYGYGNNCGIEYLLSRYNSDYILLCNPDVIIEDEVIGELESFLRKHNDYIISAPLMLDRQGVIQRNTAFKINNVYSYIMSFEMVYSKLIKPGEYRFINMGMDKMDVDAVAGSLFMFDAKKMKQYAMFDENVFLYCEERILGIKSRRAGLKIALLPRYTFIHNHSVSINKTFDSEAKKRRIMNKSAMYVVTHYYNANRLTRIIGKIVMEFSVIENYILDIFRKIIKNRKELNCLLTVSLIHIFEHD